MVTSDPGIPEAVKMPGKSLQTVRKLLQLWTAFLTMNNCMTQRNISKGCPQGSASDPGFWNIFYNSLLNLEYRQNIK